MKEQVVLEHDWFPAPVPSNVVLGERSWLYSAFAFLHYKSERPCGLRVGHDSGLYVETFFDLGPHGEVEIGNYCTVAGPIFSTNGRVVVGDYVLISREVVIGDSSIAAPGQSANRLKRQQEPNQGLETQSVITIGDDVWIGSRAVILDGAHMGNGAIIGAGAVVDFEVPPYAIVAGNPARIVGSTL